MNYDKVPELSEVPATGARRRWRIGIVALLLLLGAGGAAWWFWSEMRPVALTAKNIQQTAQVAGLEARLETLRIELAALPEESAPATRRALLEEALTRQDELMRLRQPPIAADGVLLGEWQARLDEAVARERVKQSRELEMAAEGLRRQQQPMAAAEKLREALRLQREINLSMAARATKSYGREARLQQQIEELAAEPLLEESRRALSEARVAAAGGSWTDALLRYARAREIQQQLNTDFPGSRYSDLLADGRIEAEIASLGANEAQAQRESLMQQAAAAADAGNLEAAEKLYELAADRQQVINTRFPQSPLVSTGELEKIDAERQTLRARPLVGAIRLLDRAAAGHLRRRELFQAQQQLTQARQQMEEAMRQLPLARGFDEELAERLNYLARRAADLGPIQDGAYALLVPLPDGAHVALAKTPVPQSLFVLLMNENPSRNPGRNLPVNSVSYAEASEFCRRLGWILGTMVRLPAATELQAAAGTRGFETGSMAEWLAATGSGPTAPLRERDGKEAQADRAARAPTTGFRVAFEGDLPPPPQGR